MYILTNPFPTCLNYLGRLEKKILVSDPHPRLTKSKFLDMGAYECFLKVKIFNCFEMNFNL